jgi:ADP-ribosylglycohydrolase
MSALASGELGSIESPINDSKGCGAVMRMAPAGILPPSDPIAK